VLTSRKKNSQLVVDARRRRLLYYFLVTTLYRALALAEVHNLAVLVAQYLYLDVACAGHVALDKNPVVTKAAGRLTLGRGHPFFESVGRLDNTHALAATTGGCLDQQRVAHLVGVSDTF